MNIKFLGFEKSREDEKHLGIATIVYEDRILLRYKVIQADNGGIFISAPSFKDTSDQWQKWFLIDSNIAQEYISKLIKENISGSAVKAKDDSFGHTQVPF